MVDIQVEIQQFLDDLNMAVPYPIDIDRSLTILTQQIATLFTYLYRPRVSRQSNVPGLQTNHLDGDMLLSARDKVIDRREGLLGSGPRIHARNTVVARIDKEVAMDFQ